MKPMQVATNQTTGSSIDSFTLKFRRTVSAGEVLGRREVRHCNNLVETSELWLQVRRWAVLSGTPFTIQAVTGLDLPHPGQTVPGW